MCQDLHKSTQSQGRDPTGRHSGIQTSTPTPHGEITYYLLRGAEGQWVQGVDSTI